MKIIDCFIYIQIHGECKVNILNLIKYFGKSYISKYHNEYRFHNRKAKLKLTISEEDALLLIKKLHLREFPSALFRYGSIFK